eukprot:Hpha_TRINITY_DN12768_c0_g1::TRINITY_DN12768_c0_g1_i1::g.114661::m.114661
MAGVEHQANTGKGEDVTPAVGSSRQPTEDAGITEEKEEEILQLPPFKGPTGRGLRKAVDGCLDHEIKVSEGLTVQLSDRRGILGEAMKEAAGWLKEVDEADTLDVSDVASPQLALEWQLAVECSTLYDPSASANTEAIGDVAAELQSLKETATNDERLRIFRNFIELLRHRTLEKQTFASTGQLDSTPLMKPALPSLRLLRSFVNERPPVLETAALDAELVTVEAKIEEARNEIDVQERLWWSGDPLREAAQQETDARGRGERLVTQDAKMTQLDRHRWTSEKFAAVFELHSRRLSLLRQRGLVLKRIAEANAAFKSRAASVHQKATAEIQAEREKVEEEVGRCKADMREISRRCAFERSEDDRICGEFASWRTLSDERLESNLSKQRECWAQLMQTEQLLHDLGSQRRQEVELRCRRTEEEVERRCKLAAKLTCAKAHHKLLQNQVHNARLALTLLEFTQNQLVNDVDKGVTAQRKNAKHQLQELLLRTQREELAAFRHLYHALGDLGQRKEIYATRLQQGMNQSWQLTMLYSEMHASLNADIDSLRERQRAASADFGPTEEALREARVEFAHPQNEATGPEMQAHREAYALLEQRGVEKVEAVRLDLALHKSASMRPPPGQRRLPTRESARAVVVEPHAPGSGSAALPHLGPLLAAPDRSAPAEGQAIIDPDKVPLYPAGGTDLVEDDSTPPRGRRLVPAAPAVPARQKRPQVGAGE